MKIQGSNTHARPCEDCKASPVVFEWTKIKVEFSTLYRES